jgi:hypothetical protein
MVELTKYVRPFRMIKHGPLNADRNYIFCWHPHGRLFYGFAVFCGLFDVFFPGKKGRPYGCQPSVFVCRADIGTGIGTDKDTDANTDTDTDTDIHTHRQTDTYANVSTEGQSDSDTYTHTHTHTHTHTFYGPSTLDSKLSTITREPGTGNRQRRVGWTRVFRSDQRRHVCPTHTTEYARSHGV